MCNAAGSPPSTHTSLIVIFKIYGASFSGGGGKNVVGGEGVITLGHGIIIKLFIVIFTTA